MEVVMELFGVPTAPESQGSNGTDKGEDLLNLGAWFQKGWSGVGFIGGKGADLVAGVFDRFREADALAYDNEGENTEN